MIFNVLMLDLIFLKAKIGKLTLFNFCSQNALFCASFSRFKNKNRNLPSFRGLAKIKVKKGLEMDEI